MTEKLWLLGGMVSVFFAAVAVFRSAAKQSRLLSCGSFSFASAGQGMRKNLKFV